VGSGIEFDVTGLPDLRSSPDLRFGWERRENYRFSASRCSALRPEVHAVFDLALESGQHQDTLRLNTVLRGSSGALATRRGWKGLHRSGNGDSFWGSRRRGIESKLMYIIDNK
jgi:hypothetical protein